MTNVLVVAAQISKAFYGYTIHFKRNKLSVGTWIDPPVRLSVSPVFNRRGAMKRWPNEAVFNVEIISQLTRGNTINFSLAVRENNPCTLTLSEKIIHTH